MSNSQSKPSDFTPRIVAFFCNWCTYTASDLAGTARMTYAPNARIIRVMCSGRIDPQFVMAAYRNGADGVLIGGCHPGDCHYQEGNYKCLRRITLLKRMLSQLGIESERLRLEWISASEGDRVQRVVNEMTMQIKALGPLKLNIPQPEHSHAVPTQSHTPKSKEVVS
ncbi:MAG: hydrogenase iron-sulfur subunit [bacterium]|nr:hydrogenase iron-sulfur subunit [bacterium]